MDKFYYFESNYGIIALSCKNNALSGCKILADFNTVFKKDIHIPKVINSAYEELIQYFAGELKKFTVKLEYNGTKFQNLVWNEVRNIKYAEFKTYGEIANLIGKRKAYRAVGSALSKNPLLIFIPCHRVYGLKEKYHYIAGKSIKKELIKLESEGFNDIRVKEHN